MGAPVPELEAAEDPSAEALLSSLKTIVATERRKHASVFNYWLSIRGDRQFPPIRDLDPLEISDAGSWSILLEMIGGGEDAVVRHFGQAIRMGMEVEKIGDAPNPSLLSCIHNKLPIVAACRQAFAFEEAFETDNGTTSCWVTLLPFSETGTWIDYVYGFVSLAPASRAVEEATELVEEEPQAVEDAVEPAEETLEPFKVPLRPFDEEFEATEKLTDPVEMTPEAVEEVAGSEPDLEPEAEPAEQALEPVSVDELEAQPEPGPASAAKPSFSAKVLDSLASVSGFYGTVVQAEPGLPSEIVTEEPISELTCDEEGSLHSKLSEVRAKAEEARIAQIRSDTALLEGLSAAYDFALDAEQEPEEYLRLVEAQGLKIQLRSPMKPVVKLAFDGMSDEAGIAQLEAVLAWAFKMDLPRGSLAERIEAEGGIGEILRGQDQSA